MNKTAQMLKAAQERLEDQKETIEEQREKLAAFQREKTAEEIVDMKVANGSIEPGNFIQERDRLVQSDKDLQKTKTAMREVGPGFSEDRSLVDEVPTEKEASSDDDNSSSSEYAADAASQLQERAAQIGAA